MAIIKVYKTNIQNINNNLYLKIFIYFSDINK